MAANERRLGPDAGLPSVEPSVLDVAVSGATRRLAVGLASSLPFLGAFAAFSTMQLVSATKAFSPQLLISGLKSGAYSWAPFGVGAGLFYSLERECRPIVKRLGLTGASKADLRSNDRSGDDTNESRRPLSQYEAMFGTLDPRDSLPETAASKVAAGGGSALVVTTLLWLRRRKGFRSFSSVLGMSAGCAIAAAFMPSYDAVEQRSLI